MIRPLVLSVVTVMLAACGAVPPHRGTSSTREAVPTSALARASKAPPRFRVVHIDKLEPSKTNLFERARREWLETLLARGVSDGRGHFFQIRDFGFLTLRLFDSFTDLEHIRKERGSVADPVDRASRERYDLGDAALVAPHRSEIWQREVKEIER